jgi:hypothetical protein
MGQIPPFRTGTGEVVSESIWMASSSQRTARISIIRSEGSCLAADPLRSAASFVLLATAARTGRVPISAFHRCNPH